MRALALLAVVACGPRPTGAPASDEVPWRASRIDWSTPPAAVDRTSFTPPRTVEVELANRLKLVVIENHRLPLVSIAVVHVGAGGNHLGAAPGIAALTADLLDEGAGSHDAAGLAAALELAGARLSIHTASDHASMQLVTTAERVGPAIELLADMIRRPKLADADVNRRRLLRVGELQQRLTRPRTVAAQIFDRVAFGKHGYALPADGTVASLAAATPEQVRAFWRDAYRPESTTLVVAGDVRAAELRALVTKSFADWTVPATGVSHLRSGPLPSQPQLAYVDVPRAEQTVIIIGRWLRRDNHTLAAEVANSIVGGGLGSRIDRKLHDEMAVSQGASASFWRGSLASTWTLAATVPTAATATSVRAVLDLLATARTTDVTADELARAKTNLLRSTAGAFDTTSGTVRAFERLVATRLPRDWHATYAAQLDAVTVADVRAAAHAAWSDVSIVVVGDWAKIGMSMSALGLPVVQYDRDGTIVK